jgi:hypothetical protein
MFRRIAWPDRPYPIFGAASRHNSGIAAAFSHYVSLRHQQAVELIPERPDVMTVGVLLTPRPDGRRLWDTSLAAVRGDRKFGSDVRAALERLWGSHGPRSTLDGDQLETALQAVGAALDAEQAHAT